MGQVFRKDLITIEIVAALDEKHFMKRFQISKGTTVKQAIELSMIKEFYSKIDYSALKIGIYGKIISPENELQQGDRIEIYRPLAVDPKEKRKLKTRSKFMKLRSI